MKTGVTNECFIVLVWRCVLVKFFAFLACASGGNFFFLLRQIQLYFNKLWRRKSNSIDYPGHNRRASASVTYWHTVPSTCPTIPSEDLTIKAAQISRKTSITIRNHNNLLLYRRI